MVYYLYQHLLGLMNPRIDHLRALWRRERAAVARRFAEVRAETSVAQRVARGEALKGVIVADMGPAPGGRTLLWIEGQLADFRFKPGDPYGLRTTPKPMTSFWGSWPDGANSSSASWSPARCRTGSRRALFTSTGMTYRQHFNAVTGSALFGEAAERSAIGRLRSVFW